MMSSKVRRIADKPRYYWRSPFAAGRHTSASGVPASL